MLGRLRWLEKGREGLLEELSEELDTLEGGTIQQASGEHQPCVICHVSLLENDRNSFKTEFAIILNGGGFFLRDAAVDRVVRKDGRDGNVDLYAGRSGPGAESHGGACNICFIVLVYSRWL